MKSHDSFVRTGTEDAFCLLDNEFDSGIDMTGLRFSSECDAMTLRDMAANDDESEDESTFLNESGIGPFEREMA